MDYDYYDDYYEEYYDQPDAPRRAFQREMSLEETIESCVYPSLQFALEYTLNFVVINAIFSVAVRLINRKLAHQRYLHLLSCLFGVVLMYRVMDYGYFHFLQLAISLYLVQWALNRWVVDTRNRHIKPSFVVTFCGIVNLLLSEVLAPSPESWNRVRGTQMILLMKVLSLSFDIDDNGTTRNHLNLLSYAGYILCPANVILGPWISFSDYLAVWRNTPGDTKGARTASVGRQLMIYVFRVFTSALLAIGFLLTSNCFIDYLLGPAGNSWKWIRAYSRALSFRTSHYFVAYLSQCTMIAATIERNRGSTDDPRGSWMIPSSSIYRVTSPIAVEFPRSMVQIVTAWNIPMHHWLKRYIFRSTKRSLGTATAIAVTYLVSSLLHGLHYRLWVTLLSIGAWTYVEHELRKKIANIYSACVLVGRCPTRCTAHTHRAGSLFTLVINTLFFLLNIFNLIYLGCIFEPTERLPEESKRDHSIFAPWSELQFVSHWALAFAYLFFVII
ncbi:protein-serine O-palmitoleoyltransferase porcupine-like [Anopheles albimanus]|uniref:Protein-serine O-palmitoleoyltransferase porcupine n=1 Tax=Anopheles albimanus TaxID=7167 RepID=A0A182F305_ANOAL|nr:protein-serine O-palmitoleoyltransferase porcupine-like [Anopheles albimanus]